MTTEQPFGEALKQLRKRSGLSQEAFAAAIYDDGDKDAYRQKIGRIERESTPPPESELTKIIAVLSRNLNWSKEEVERLLFSKAPQEAVRENALTHVHALRTSIEALLVADLTRDAGEQLDNLLKGIIRDLLQTVNILERLMGLVPESAFWDAFLRYVRSQNVVGQLVAAQLVLPFGKLTKEKAAFDAAISYFSRMSFRAASLESSSAGNPVDLMKRWVNILRDGDELTATHYAKAQDSWEKPAWLEYHNANIAAAKRGVKITRYFIYDTDEERTLMEKFMREQSDVDINVKSISSREVKYTVLDIAVVMKRVLGILTWEPNAPRTPFKIEFAPMEQNGAQRGFIESYNDILDKQSKPFKPKTVVHVSSSKIKTK